MKERSRVYAEISLKAIAHNYLEIKKKVHTKVLCVIKANAYGHGSVQVAKMLSKYHPDYFAVATVDEAIELRQNGIKTPILILGYVHRDEIPLLISYDITASLYDYETALLLSDAAKKAGTSVKVHIKLNTGMNRIGFNAYDTEHCISEVVRSVRLPGIDLEGIFTHFSISDEAGGRAYTEEQLSRFQKVCEGVENSGFSIPIRHCSNSGAILQYDETYFDMVRAGIVLYGYYPDKTTKQTIPLKPAMTIKAKVIQVADMDENVCVSYGGTYVTKKPSRRAVLSIGYADGYLRAASNKAEVVISGRKAPIIGRICMDMCIADVTEIPNVKRDDDVIILGDCEVTADTLAQAAGTISYEVLCEFSHRVPKYYVD